MSYTSLSRAHADRSSAVQDEDRRLIRDEHRVIAAGVERRVENTELLVNTVHRRRRRLSDPAAGGTLRSAVHRVAYRRHAISGLYRAADAGRRRRRRRADAAAALVQRRRHLNIQQTTAAATNQ